MLLTSKNNFKYIEPKDYLSLIYYCKTYLPKLIN